MVEACQLAIDNNKSADLGVMYKSAVVSLSGCPDDDDADCVIGLTVDTRPLLLLLNIVAYWYHVSWHTWGAKLLLLR